MSAVEAHALHEPDGVQNARTKLVGSRLMLAANGSVQLSFLFAFLYLRTNNFDGGWLPDGVGSPPGLNGVVIQVLQVLSLVALVGGAASIRRGLARDTELRLGGVVAALILGLAGLGARIYQLLHTGWTTSQGTYVDVSVLWFGVLAAQVLFGCLWMLKVFTNRTLRNPLETGADLRAVTEYWGFMTVVSIMAAALVQFVH